jgi:putative oxidoreductase
MKGFRIGLWAAQALLAVVFTAAALAKLAQPYETLAASQAWVRLFSPETVMVIGIVELSAAIGVVLPAATRILPGLTPLAAAGLVLLMLGAGATHISIGELPIANVILGGLAAFVAWGRYRKAPIPSRRAQPA